jgi:hypothetical protein
MSVRSDVLLWAQRVIARQAAPAHQILEIAAGSGLPAAQEAFHKIARMAHPDLHRTGLTPDELELVTTAYGRAAAAYQEIRSEQQLAARMRPIRGLGSDPALVPPTTPVPTSPPLPRAAAQPAHPPVSHPDHRPANPAHAMTSRALLYYRKAELGLRRGDLTGAVLQLKMAIASDPQSQFLRSALAEVEAEVGKKP